MKTNAEYFPVLDYGTFHFIIKNMNFLCLWIRAYRLVYMYSVETWLYFWSCKLFLNIRRRPNKCYGTEQRQHSVLRDTVFTDRTQWDLELFDRFVVRQLMSQLKGIKTNQHVWQYYDINCASFLLQRKYFKSFSCFCEYTPSLFKKKNKKKL